jgi:hypothetical protein
MRSPRAPIHALVAAAALTACSDDPATGPRLDDETEVARPEVELLVERVAGGGERSFYTMAPDGSRVSERAGFPADAFLVTPSPDGRRLAYLRPVGGFVHAFVMDRDGGARTPLLEGERAVQHLAWSPDGTRLALQVSELASGADDVYVVNADGSGVANLTPDPLPGIWADRAPAWSPDGTRIAFSSNRSGVTRLWVMGADGTGPAPVVDPAFDSTERAPAWSPDGSLLAFAGATAAGGSGVGVVRPDGTGYRLVPVRELVGRLAWSPDGRLLHATAEHVDAEVFALDVGTGERTNLTRHRADDREALPLRLVTPAPWRGLAAPALTGGGSPGATALALGDLVADGRPDVAILAPSTEQVRLLRGQDGALPAPVGALDAGPDARALALGDVSGDGATDVVTIGPGGLTAWRGGPAGTGVPATYALPGDVRALALADLDASGTAEVVTLHDRPGSPFHVAVHVADVDGGLVYFRDGATAHASPVAACAADATGEGNPDLVVAADQADAPLLLFPGQGDGTFALEVAVAPPGFAPVRTAVLVCADLDGDRRADLALLDPGGAGLAVLRSGDAGFGAPRTYGVVATALASADLDRDGDVDLLAAGPGAAEVLFLRNLGDGRLARPAPFPAGGTPRALAAADLDGDAWPDVAIALADGSVAVLRNLGR